MAIFEELKSIAGVLKEADKIEQYQQILDAQQELLKMQSKIAELEDENKSLKEKLRTKESLIYENHAYWTNKEGKKEGPFCSRCWDKNKDLIRMLPYDGLGNCPECQTTVQIVPNHSSRQSEKGNSKGTWMGA